MIELLLVPLLVLVGGFEDEFVKATQETGLNFKLIQHEDLSVSLYAYQPNATIGSDGLADVLTPIAGYPNVESLSGANGVKDVLSKVKYWNMTN